MSDYRVTLKVQNGRLWKAMKDAGLKGPPQLAKAAGISYGSLVSLISMKQSPVYKNGEFRPVVIKLAEYLGLLPEDLFTPAQYEVVESNTREFYMAEREVAALVSDANAHPDKFIAAQQTRQIVDQSTLSPRERQVLALRFEDDMTFAQAGEAMGVSHERARQILERALRKLRHPDYSGRLRETYEELAA